MVVVFVVMVLSGAGRTSASFMAGREENDNECLAGYASVIPPGGVTGLLCVWV